MTEYLCASCAGEYTDPQPSGSYRHVCPAGSGGNVEVKDAQGRVIGIRPKTPMANPRDENKNGVEDRKPR